MITIRVQEISKTLNAHSICFPHPLSHDCAVSVEDSYFFSISFRCLQAASSICCTHPAELTPYVLWCCHLKECLGWNFSKVTDSRFTCSKCSGLLSSRSCCTSLLGWARSMWFSRFIQSHFCLSVRGPRSGCGRWQLFGTCQNCRLLLLPGRERGLFTLLRSRAFCSQNFSRFCVD